MGNAFDHSEDRVEHVDVEQKVVGDDKPEPVVESTETNDGPVDIERPDIKLKLNPDNPNVDADSYISVPGFDEIQLSSTAKAVEYEHAQLLLSTNLVVAE